MRIPSLSPLLLLGALAFFGACSGPADAEDAPSESAESAQRAMSMTELGRALEGKWVHDPSSPFLDVEAVTFAFDPVSLTTGFSDYSSRATVDMVHAWVGEECAHWDWEQPARGCMTDDLGRWSFDRSRISLQPKSRPCPRLWPSEPSWAPWSSSASCGGSSHEYKFTLSADARRLTLSRPSADAPSGRVWTRLTRAVR